ncbi:concanavalin A-like lectin/glucanase domain-containing protein [Aspergillus egyptiacus]|nr:concanavalin A-like lectin/glucanase domain-containing protein [Aspergillus egyptiacus]
MKLRLTTLATGLSCLASVAAQTYTDCNPMEQTCPPDPAFGTSASYDFTKGPSNDFTEVGSPTYGSDGAEFTVSKQGDSPLIQSKWYIMFGHVEFVIKAAPGVGIVSSAVLQSDNLDEIDWEWLGGNNVYVQTNYFGKGNTDNYNRAATHENPGNQDSFHTYTIDWTSSQIVWQIDGKTVRVLTPDAAEADHYPQTPMMVKVGVWAGGDPNNSQGTIQWAGGVTDYSDGPFSMYLKSLKVTDYSTGKSYTYGDKSGSWGSIISDGGAINGNDAAQSVSDIGSVPSATATADNGPIPFEGTHMDPTGRVTPSIYPWVPRPSSDEEDSPSTSLPGGWTWAGSGNTKPPTRYSMSEHCPQSRSVSSEFLLNRCHLLNQYTLPSTSASPPSSSGSSFPSAPEITSHTHPSAPRESKTTRLSITTTEEMDSLTSVTERNRAGAPDIAPPTNAANCMLDNSLISGALFALFCKLLLFA